MVRSGRAGAPVRRDLVSLAAVRDDWFAEARSSGVPVATVAEALGLRVLRGRRIDPCPACRRSDPREPSVSAAAGNGLGWRCHACDASGDALGLAALVLVGTEHPSGADWGRVRDWYAAHGWCSAAGARSAPWTPPPIAARPVEEVAYPDGAELRTLLRGCRPIDAVAEVAEWCRGRGLVGRVPAAVLPDVARWPGWWPWGRRPWRLVVSMVDASGTIRGMHGRATEPHDGPKTRWPYRCRASGLLFADPVVARPMLRGEAAPRRVIVCEGMTDYLAAACRAPGDVAVLGASSGGFGALRGVKIPNGATVVIATDDDKAGDAYAAEIRAALAGREITLKDWRRRGQR